jgi:uncharacterized protein (TIGR03067 family)
MKQSPIACGSRVAGAWICVTLLLVGCAKEQGGAQKKESEAEKPSSASAEVNEHDKKSLKKPADPLAEAKGRSKANLKKIATAFEKYEAANRHYPIGLIDPEKHWHGLSWRVQILPYLDDAEAAKIFKQFRLNEPWDSEHNEKLLAKMPKVYAPVRGHAQEGFTFYQGFADHLLESKGEKWPKDRPLPRGLPGAFFEDPRTFARSEEKATGVVGLPDRARKLQSVTDGTANTFLVAEAGDAVPWTKPQDIPYRRELNKPEEGICPKLGGLFGGDFHVVMVDGTIHYIKKDVAPEKLRPFITFSGGEKLDYFSIGLEPPDWSEIKPFVGTWLRTSFEENGKKHPPDESKKFTATFRKDGTLTFSENKTVLTEGEFFVYAEGTKTPKQVRWDWKGEVTDRVIYSFEGEDKLVTCWTRQGTKWPTRFATGSPEGGTYLAVWKRIPQ